MSWPIRVIISLPDLASKILIFLSLPPVAIKLLSLSASISLPFLNFSWREVSIWMLSSIASDSSSAGNSSISPLRAAFLFLRSSLSLATFSLVVSLYSELIYDESPSSWRLDSSIWVWLGSLKVISDVELLTVFPSESTVWLCSIYLLPE